MKLFVIFSALLALVTAVNVTVDDTADLENNPVYGYLTKVAVPLAEKIRKAEAQTFNKLDNAVEPTLKIVDGSAARPGELPYQAGLIMDLRFGGPGTCGGSLVSAGRVLTAAHCWYDGRHEAWRVTVVLGTVWLYRGGVRIPSTKVVVHPGWNFKNFFNDIAMIILPYPVKFSDYIQPISLPTGWELHESYVGYKVIASGFGNKRTGLFGGPNTYLSLVQVQVVPNGVCQQYFHNMVISKICAKGLRRESTCHGDSGGPIAVFGLNKRRTLVGITSFGSDSCDHGNPVSYTRVTAFMDWIVRQM